MKETIHLKFSAKNKSLSDFPIEKIFNLIKKYINVLSEISKNESPKNVLDVRDITLESISNGSADICLRTNTFGKVSSEKLLELQYAEMIELPETKQNVLDSITKLYNEMRLPDGTPVTLETENKNGKFVPVELEKFGLISFEIPEIIDIYGEILHVGGGTPNFHIVDIRGVEFIVENISKDFAQNMGHKLYLKTGVRVRARFKFPERKYDTRVEFMEILPYIGSNWEENIQKIRAEFRDNFSEDRSMREIFDEIRRESRNEE